MGSASIRRRRPIHVTGIELADGTPLPADLVIDAAGRRTPVPAWLAEHGVDVPCDLQTCGAVYYARYYRLNPAAGTSLFGILGVREEIDGLGLVGFPGDHGTYGLGAFVPDDDEELKVLRHDWAWDVTMAAVPRTAPWASPDVGVPLNDVQFMGGHQNVRRRYIVDGRPLVLGLLPVGDSLCTTNPMYGWGASMALTYAFAAVDAATAHPDDPEAMALAYDDAVAAEADAVFNESAAMDRTRGYRWRNEEVPEWDRAEAERQELIVCIARGALRDPVLGRAMLRRTNLLEPPDAVLSDPLVVERARNVQAILAAKAAKPPPITRAGLLDLLAAARPSP